MREYPRMQAFFNQIQGFPQFQLSLVILWKRELSNWMTIDGIIHQ